MQIDISGCGHFAAPLCNRNYCGLPVPPGCCNQHQQVGRRVMRPWLRHLTKTILIMKMIVILLTTALLQVHASGTSQTVTLSGKDLELKKVFADVQRQTGFLFFYNTSSLQGTHPVTITASEVPLEIFLQKLLQDQPLEYTIKHRTIFISRKKTQPGPPLLVDQVEQPARIDVKGTIHDEKNAPAEGITITVKGTTKGTVSDAKGAFILRDIEENATLQISSVNHERQEIKINGRTEIQVQLKIRAADLTEVNVTVSNGYQDIPKERSTGSFEVVKGEKLQRSMATDLLSRLEGVATGLQFDRRELFPGRSKMNQSSITIRGISTLTTTIKAPLIILDNFPYEGDINNINPYDIESVTILRDAAASSIWGARAANGVIVITTKKGRQNQALQVTLTANTNIHAKPDLFKFPAMSTSDYIDLETYLFNKGHYDGDLNSTSYSGLSPVVELLAQRRKGAISPADFAAKIDALRSKDVRNDFNKYVYQTAIDQLYSLNLSGGTDKLQFALSGSYAAMPTFLRGVDSRRITLNTNQTFKPLKNLSINLKLNYSSTDDKTNTLGNYGDLEYRYGGFRYMPPYTTFKDDQGNYATYPFHFREGYTDTAGGGALLDWKYRILQEMENKNDRSRANEVLINTQIQYQVTKTLSASFAYQYRNSNRLFRRTYSLQSYYARNEINSFTNLRAIDGPSRNPLPIGGILDDYGSGSRSQDGRVQINYNEVIGGRHQVSAVVAADIRKTEKSYSNSRIYGYNEDNLSFSDVNYFTSYPLYGDLGSSRIPSQRSLGEGTNNYVSLTGNAAYTYNNRYTFSASARRDAANVLGVATNNQWKPFWSAGIGWNASHESFFQVPAINNLEFKLSYGYQGNVLNTLSPLTIIRYLQNADQFGLYYASITVAANPDLRWEEQNQWNFITNISLLKNRLGATLDIWRKRSEDVISYQQVDPTTGVVRVSSNSAGLGAQGFDLKLTSVNIRGAFQWNTEFSISMVKNKVTKLDTMRYRQPPFANGAISFNHGFLMVPGWDPKSLYSYPFAGLDPATGDPLGYLGGKVSKAYDKIINQGFDTAGLVRHGSSAPLIFGFINNTVSYKKIRLLVTLTYNLKYFFKRAPIQYYSLIGEGNPHGDYSKRWQKPGDELHTTVPSLAYPSNYNRDNFYANSSVNVLRGDNIKISNLSLSYDITIGGSAKKIIRQMQVYTSVQNLGALWIANKEKIDPDMSYGNATFPNPLRVGIGVQLTF